MPEKESLQDRVGQSAMCFAIGIGLLVTGTIKHIARAERAEGLDPDMQFKLLQDTCNVVAGEWSYQRSSYPDASYENRYVIDCSDCYEWSATYIPTGSEQYDVGTECVLRESHKGRVRDNDYDCNVETATNDQRPGSLSAALASGETVDCWLPKGELPPNVYDCENDLCLKLPNDTPYDDVDELLDNAYILLGCGAGVFVIGLIVWPREMTERMIGNAPKFCSFCGNDARRYDSGAAGGGVQMGEVVTGNAGVIAKSQV